MGKEQASAPAPRGPKAIPTPEELGVVSRHPAAARSAGEVRRTVAIPTPEELGIGRPK
jgi:hypothetical protein